MVPLAREQEKLYTMETNQCWKEVTVPLLEAREVEASIPWSLACSPGRFPYWWASLALTCPQVRLSRPQEPRDGPGHGPGGRRHGRLTQVGHLFT